MILEHIFRNKSKINLLYFLSIILQENIKVIKLFILKVKNLKIKRSLFIISSMPEILILQNLNFLKKIHSIFQVQSID